MNSTIDALARTALEDGKCTKTCRPAAVLDQPLPGSMLAPPGHGSVSSFQAECLLLGNVLSRLVVRVRFLRPALKRCGRMPPVREALEREIALEQRMLEELAEGLHQPFVFPPALEVDGDTERFQFAIEGAMEVTARSVGSRLYRITTRIENRTPSDRVSADLRTLSSAHIIMQVHGGEFVSLSNPPDDFRGAVAECHNPNVWPILAGDPRRRDTMLASAMVLSDFSVAPTSVVCSVPSGESDPRLRSHQAAEWERRSVAACSIRVAQG